MRRRLHQPKNKTKKNPSQQFAMVVTGGGEQSVDFIAGWPTNIAGVTRIDLRLEQSTINFRRQDVQRMFVIENLREFPAEQFPLRVRIFRLHDLPENEEIRELFWQIVPRQIDMNSLDFRRMCEFSGATK